MKRKALLGLSAILFVGIITFTWSNLVGPYAIRALRYQGGSVLRADDPAPPFPPPELSSPSGLRADDPAPPFPPQGASSPSDAKVS